MRICLNMIACICAIVATGCERSETSPPAPGASVVDDREPPVREVTGLTSPPDQYLATHLSLWDTDSPDWQSAVDQLHANGDAFTLSLIRDIDVPETASAQRESLATLAESIRTRLPHDELAPSDVQRLLETAAYSDLMCHQLENTLRTWTLKTVAQHIDNSQIRSELVRIRDNYKSQLGTETLFDAMDNRVPLYARQLLEDDSEAD